MSASVVRRAALAAVLALAALSFVTFLVLLALGDDLDAPPSNGSDGYSISALGHGAFIRLLEESGLRVTSSRFDSARRAGADSLLIVAEPDFAADDVRARRLFEGMIRRPGPTLVVLPRRIGFGDRASGAHVRATGEHDVSVPLAVLERIDASFRVARVPADGESFDARDWGPKPDLPSPVQVISPTSRLEPLVTLGADVVFGRVVSRRSDDRSDVYVLADPDLVATHGLVRGDNAVLLVSIVARLCPPDGHVVVDETLHGLDVHPSLWRELFRPPLRYATCSAVLAALVLVGAGVGRFGRPRPSPPPIEPGKRFLVDHTADLLRYGRHAGHALERYLAASIQDVGRRLHAPSSLDAKALEGWLSSLERPNREAPSLEELADRVARSARERDVGRVVDTAMAVHRWKEAATNGSRDDS